MKENKMKMAWGLFIVWTITIILTLALNRDVSVLSIVSGVYGIVVSYFFKLRADEKKNA